jgi:DNA primase catalytic subunit
MDGLESLKAWYSNNPVDLDWLDKPSRHQVRWRLLNNRWVTASRQFRSAESLQKELARHGPRDVYIGTSAWLTPLNLPKRSDEDSAPPVLLDHLVVFDIDFRPFCYRRLEKARQATSELLVWLEANEPLELVSISYSGGKGFHLILQDTDRALYAIPGPREREDAVRASREALLDRVVEQGFPVDRTVTADTRRVIRLPGSLHGTTRWACSRITPAQLHQPLKGWVDMLVRDQASHSLPYWPYGIRDVIQWPKKRLNARRNSKNKKSTPARLGNNATTHPLMMTFQASTQVVGTKERSAFMAWIPERWTAAHMKAVAERIRELGWGPVHRFNSLERTLLVAPRAIPIQQLRKVLPSMGLQAFATQLGQLGHAWVDASPVKTAENELEGELNYAGPWEEAGVGRGTVPWSATHLELIRRFGVEVDTGADEVAGRPEPALRMVVKE